MAIRIVVGKPRSGKTYYAVTHLVENYFKFEDGEYNLLPQFSDIQIVTNIEELKIPHHKLEEWIEKSGNNVQQFFSKEYQCKIYEKYNRIIYIIDECHDYFPPSLRAEPIYSWFSYHAHLGQDIYLLTQCFENLPRRIVKLSELSIEAVPHSLSLTGGRELKYNEYSNNTKINSFPIVLMKKNKVFALYKSQRTSSAQKVKNPFTGMTILIIVALVLVLGWTINHWSKKGEKREEFYANQEQQKNTTLKSRYGNSQIQEEEEPKIIVKVGYVRQNGATLLMLGKMTWLASAFPHELKKDAFNNPYVRLTQQQKDIYFPPNYENDETRSSRESAGSNQHKKR